MKICIYVLFFACQESSNIFIANPKDLGIYLSDKPVHIIKKRRRNVLKLYITKIDAENY